MTTSAGRVADFETVFLEVEPAREPADIEEFQCEGLRILPITPLCLPLWGKAILPIQADGPDHIPAILPQIQAGCFSPGEFEAEAFHTRPVGFAGVSFFNGRQSKPAKCSLQSRLTLCHIPSPVGLCV